MPEEGERNRRCEQPKAGVIVRRVYHDSTANGEDEPERRTDQHDGSSHSDLVSNSAPEDVHDELHERPHGSVCVGLEALVAHTLDQSRSV